MTSPTVLVTDAGLGSAVAVIRSLSRAGCRVIAADRRWFSEGMVSRYPAARTIYPSPEHNPLAFVDRIEEIVRNERVDVVFPVTDAAILPLDGSRDRFEGRCTIAMAPTNALAVAADKYRVVVDGAAIGMTVPTTHLVRTVGEAVDAAGDFHWPIVVKPRRSAVLRPTAVERSTVTYADSETELRQAVGRLEGRSDILLQDWYPGRGVGIDLLMYDGEPQLALQHERLRELPVHGGPGTLRRSMPLDPELFRMSVELLSQWGWTGLAMVEFRSSQHGDVLMEVNGRVWGSIPLSGACGVDFPAEYVRLLLGGSSSGALLGDYAVGKRVRHLSNDLLWIASVVAGRPQRRRHSLPSPTRRAAARAVLDLLDPRIVNDVQSWRDPLPGLVELSQLVTRTGRKFSGRHTPRPRSRVGRSQG